MPFYFTLAEVVFLFFNQNTMKRILFALLLFPSQLIFSQTITTKFEQTNGTQTPTYYEIIDWWKKLDQQSPEIKMLTMGMTDAGFPLNLVVVSNDGDYNFENIHKKNKRIILINNGIHPGEPDGIDASMLLARDIVINKYKLPSELLFWQLFLSTTLEAV